VFDTQDIANQVMANVDIRRLVEERYAARHVHVEGSELICSCLFPENHPGGDKNPSFGIDLNTGLFSCFSCHVSGNIAMLVMQKENVAFQDAIKILEGYQNGVSTPAELAKKLVEYRQAPSVDFPKRIPSICEDITRWHNIYNSYWESRGFIRETVNRFSLGYDPTCDRVVIPVWFRGKAVGWSKRACGQQQPKYIHYKGFERNKCLFNFDDVPYSPLDSDSKVIVVESPMSAIWLQQCGIDNAVATFGAHLSGQQAMWLRQFNHICLWYDPDYAGQKGMIDAIDTLGWGKHITVITDVPGDPNELSKEECLKIVAEKEIEGLYFRSGVI